jgi:hypothetical protein
MNLYQRFLRFSKRPSEKSRSSAVATAAKQPIEIHISPRKIACSLSGLVCFLVCASTVGQLHRYLWAGGKIAGKISALEKLFFVDLENNIPSAYSAFALLLCSVLLSVIAVVRLQQHDRFARHWQILAFIFLYLALDELVAIHELTIEPLRHKLGASGVLYYTWIVPGAILVLIFGLSYLKFLWALPQKIRRLFILAGITFIGGALMMEFPEGWIEANYGKNTIAFLSLVTLEETLEMLSIIIFIYALLIYIRSYVQKVISLKLNDP